jgi:phosphoglycerate kinase
MTPRVDRLRDRPIRPGERWIFSAGFNVDPRLTSTVRIDTELADLRRLADAGARVAVLSHQGSHRDGTARPLDFVVPYLSERLGRTVRYVPENVGPAAERCARELRPGDVAVFGNTRAHAGDEANDPGLAARFAALGEVVAVGGFARAHRVNASTVGLLELLPGYAADSLLAETALLDPYAGIDDSRYSVAVLGGTKPEKVLLGLDRLSRTYDLVVPGGVVLNCLLRAAGYDVGGSVTGTRPEQCLQICAAVLDGRRAELHLPATVVVAPRSGDGAPEAVPIADGVPADAAIVDFVLPPPVERLLATLPDRPVRAVVAGTPARYTDGFTGTCDRLLAALPVADTVLLGGDTVAELPWAGPVGAGGGAALHYLAAGTCPVLDALARTAAHGRRP